jgi:hypothetical protein
MDLASVLTAPRFERCCFCSPLIERRVNPDSAMVISAELAACKDLKHGVKK